MCCGDERGYIEMVDECDDCGGGLSAHGDPEEQCMYSPVSCTECDSRPCDMSC